MNLLPEKKSSLPFSKDAEAACLGALLLNNNLFEDVFTKLNPEDFYDGRHKLIAKTLIAFRLEKGDMPLDLITLGEELRKKDLLHRVGGLEYINSLVDSVPSTTNVKDYANIVFEKSLLRKIITIGGETIDEAKQSHFSSEVLDKCMQKYFALSFEEYKDYEHISNSLKSTIDIIEKNYRDQGYVGISSGYKKLDELIVGFQKSNLIIIGGRTGMGKTAFALNMVENMAFVANDKSNGEDKLGIGFFSLEMSKTEICMRILANQTNISLNEFKNASFKDSKWQSLIQTADRAKKTNILIDDTPGIDIRELSSKARKMVKDGVDIIFVDYLQLITEQDNQISREQQISSVSKQLKNLARTLNLPIIALTQLNRSADSREDKTPRLSDIRESGAIEQDADLVLFIHRSDDKKVIVQGTETLDEASFDKSSKNLASSSPSTTNDFYESKFPTKIYVSKNRHGPIGEVKLTFIGKYLRFTEDEY